MAVFHKLGKFVCNGFLLVILILIIALCLLNLINPSLPSLRCEPGHGVKEPSISHVYHGDTVSTLKLFFAVIGVPFLQMVVIEWFCNKENPYTINANESSRWKRTMLRVSRWFRDYIYGLAVVLLLNDIGKTTLNSPRPHFLDSCKPNFTKESCHTGWLSDYECTNTEITRWRLADARKSFPSGHSALSFYAAFFMGIYQHKRINKRVMGTLFLLWLHILWFGFAIFCSSSRVADKRHHPVDVTFGGILGAIGGICSAIILCKGFGKPLHLGVYQSKVVSGAHNGSATILDGFPNSPPGNGPLPPGMNGGSRPPTNGEKRPSLRRLLSTQSTMTQMTDIVEDRELDSL
ncbi:phospholipid phosphatase 1 isoform X2 [Folsomia candida]|uniref:phospholipid phosphatase 1 isoform X2 n=1 Tax=Folsomia candida TaxID=158441 RepID=UPI000B907CF6|nr:phospholipid phosphatase 1 isoform X2 [Folsomia candida]XP_035715765.1 phospholipid phosphatase 1 isoform X2 [Folsomia candida]